MSTREGDVPVGGERELLARLMGRLGLAEFYRLAGALHAESMDSGGSPEDVEHGLAGAGAQVAGRLLGLSALVETEGAVWEQRNETYADYAADEALELFWVIIAALVPGAKTGDLEAGSSARLKLAAREAVAEWIALNVPEGEAASLLG